MTDFALRSVDTFPPGTTVDAYLASNWSTGLLPPSGAPLGSSVETKTMGASGVTFTGLATGTRYFIAGQVGGTWRYVRVRIGVPSGPLMVDSPLHGDLSGTSQAAVVAAVNGVAVTNAPTAGKVLTADSATTASWQ